jgi:hypothetical protein
MLHGPGNRLTDWGIKTGQWIFESLVYGKGSILEK